MPFSGRKLIWIITDILFGILVYYCGRRGLDSFFRWWQGSLFRRSRAGSYRPDCFRPRFHKIDRAPWMHEGIKEKEGREETHEVLYSWSRPHLLVGFLAFLIFFGLFQNTFISRVKGWIFLTYLILAAWIDAVTGFLPNQLTYSMLATGISLSAYSGTGLVGPEIYLLESTMGIIFGYLLLWTADKVASFYSKEPQVGGGDLKFLSAIGSWLGASALFQVLALANCIALMICIKKRQRWVRFAPYLSFAAGISVLYRFLF